MNGQHFKELLETVCKSTGYSKKEISNLVGATDCTLSTWQRQGVPVAIKPHVIHTLTKAVFTAGKWRKKNKMRGVI